MSIFLWSFATFFPLKTNVEGSQYFFNDFLKYSQGENVLL